MNKTNGLRLKDGKITVCNEQECKDLFNTGDIASCIKQYPNKLIVTLGEKGAIYYNGTSIIHIPEVKGKEQLKKYIDSFSII